MTAQASWPQRALRLLSRRQIGEDEPRSDFRGGLIGLFAAPTIGTLPLIVPVFAYALVDRLGGNDSDGVGVGVGAAAGAAAIIYLAMLVHAYQLMMIVGVPVWLVLNWLGRESSSAYICLGTVGGALLFDLANGERLASVAIGAVAGASVAGAFWWIARRSSGVTESEVHHLLPR